MNEIQLKAIMAAIIYGASVKYGASVNLDKQQALDDADTLYTALVRGQSIAQVLATR
jgi:hypothetical protein